MQGRSLFWAFALILAGGLLLLSNMGLLPGVNIWSLLWPALLIAAGLWFIWATLVGPRGVKTEEAAFPLEGARRLALKVAHGAGELRLAGGAGADQAVAGSFGGGVNSRIRREGDTLQVKLGLADQFFTLPWAWGPGGLDWDVKVNSGVPVELKLECGASRSQLDLSELLISELTLHTGASATEVMLPAQAGFTQVKIEAGAASVKVQIPGGVAARIRAEGGLARIDVDETRFPKQGSVYQSPDYEAATNRVDIRIETGVGSVDVR
jgi:hypothetical protein